MVVTVARLEKRLVETQIPIETLELESGTIPSPPVAPVPCVPLVPPIVL